MVQLFDLGILNGKIYVNGNYFLGNIYTKNSKIAAITKSFLEAAEEYDADGKYILPGFIDPHVHFELTVGQYTSVDDFRSGSISAAYGGITTYIDFLDPVNNKEALDKAFKTRMKLAKNSIIDYSFHTTIADLDDNPIKFIEKTKELGIPTIKLFTTYSTTKRRTMDKTIDKLLAFTKETDTLLLAHTENDGLVLEGEKILVSKHEEARPAIAEISEVIKLAEMTKYRDGRMYIVHTNCGTTLERLTESYDDILNKDFIIESCPHYFYLSSDIYESEYGHLYTMTPPLRSEYEKEKLNSFIDYVYTIGTDHCPFSRNNKEKIYINDIPMGIGGVEYSFPLMYSLYGDKVIDKFTINPAVVHGLYPKKGHLLPGADADIVIFDPEQKNIIKQHHSKADYIPYYGLEIKGNICSTISRGRFIIKDGAFYGGSGNYLFREVKSY